MTRPNAQTVRTARLNVKRWFAETPLGPVFLPGDGRALPLSREEEAAIRAGAERKIVETGEQVHRRVWLHIAIVVAVFMLVRSWRGDAGPDWRPLLDVASYVIYAGHGLSVAHAFWQWERSIFTLRDAISHSLNTRVPLPPEVAGPRASPEPNYRLLGTLAFGLLGVVLIVEAAPLLPQSREGWLSHEMLGWVMAIALGGIAAVVTYLLGETALRHLSDAFSRDRSR